MSRSLLSISNLSSSDPQMVSLAITNALEETDNCIHNGQPDLERIADFFEDSAKTPQGQALANEVLQTLAQNSGSPLGVLMDHSSQPEATNALSSWWNNHCGEGLSKPQQENLMKSLATLSTLDTKAKVALAMAPQYEFGADKNGTTCKESRESPLAAQWSQLARSPLESRQKAVFDTTLTLHSIVNRLVCASFDLYAPAGTIAALQGRIRDEVRQAGPAVFAEAVQALTKSDRRIVEENFLVSPMRGEISEADIALVRAALAK